MKKMKRFYTVNIKCEMESPIKESNQKNLIFWNSILDSYIEFADCASQYRRCKKALMWGLVCNAIAVTVKNDFDKFGNFSNTITLTFKFVNLKDSISFKSSVYNQIEKVI